MSALMDLINKKRDQIQAQQGRQNTIRPKVGRNRYRILPSWRGENQQFWHDYGQHFIKGNDGKIKAVFLCLEHTFNQECPICRALSEARKRVDDETGLKLKEAYAGRRVLLNVIEVSGSPDSLATAPQPQILEVGPSVFDSILSQFSEWSEALVDLNKGRDIYIERSGVGMNTRYTVAVAGQETSYTKFADAIMQNLPNLDNYVKQNDESGRVRALSAISEVSGVLPAPSKPALSAVPNNIETTDVVDVTPVAEPVAMTKTKPVAEAKVEPAKPMPEIADAMSITEGELNSFLSDL